MGLKNTAVLCEKNVANFKFHISVLIVKNRSATPWMKTILLQMPRKQSKVEAFWNGPRGQFFASNPQRGSFTSNLSWLTISIFFKIHVVGSHVIFVNSVGNSTSKASSIVTSLGQVQAPLAYRP